VNKKNIIFLVTDTVGVIRLTTFHFLHSLQMGPISKIFFPWQAFQAQ
jgi:hypothetical protein